MIRFSPGLLKYSRLIPLPFVLFAASLFVLAILGIGQDPDSLDRVYNLLLIDESLLQLLDPYMPLAFSLFNYPVFILFGPHGPLVLNVIFAVGAWYFTYRVARIVGDDDPRLAVILLGSFPFYFYYSIQAIPAIPASMLLMMTLSYFFEDKPYRLAGCATIISFFRKEMILCGFVVFLYLLWKRKFLAALLGLLPQAIFYLTLILTPHKQVSHFELESSYLFYKEFARPDLASSFLFLFLQALHAFGPLSFFLAPVMVATSLAQKKHRFILLITAVFFLYLLVLLVYGRLIQSRTITIAAPLIAILLASTINRLHRPRSRLFYLFLISLQGFLFFQLLRLSDPANYTYFQLHLPIFLVLNLAPLILLVLLIVVGERIRKPLMGLIVLFHLALPWLLLPLPANPSEKQDLYRHVYRWLDKRELLDDCLIYTQDGVSMFFYRIILKDTVSQDCMVKLLVTLPTDIAEHKTDGKAVFVLFDQSIYTATASHLTYRYFESDDRFKKLKKFNYHGNLETQDSLFYRRDDYHNAIHLYKFTDQFKGSR